MVNLQAIFGDDYQLSAVRQTEQTTESKQGDGGTVAHEVVAGNPGQKLDEAIDATD